MPQVARLIGDITADHDAPKQYHAGYTLDGDTGTGSTGPFDPNSELIKTNDDILRKMGLDPKAWIIDGNIHQWSKQMQDGTMRVSIFAGFHRKTEENEQAARDLAKLIIPITPRETANGDGDPLVFVISDPQVGKLDEKGGTPQLIRRYENMLGQVAAIARDQKPSRIIIADCGDSIENIFNYSNQLSHVDLTLDQQLAQWQRMFIQAIQTMRQYCDDITVTAVPSNHGEVRNAMKAQTGNGDYGIGVLRQISDAYDLIGSWHPTFVFPDSEWADCSHLDISGHTLLFAHGHNSGKQDKIPKWIEGQAANRDSPFATADVVVTGHYHNRRYLTSHGRHIVECPTLESSSNWLYKTAGEWSQPGVTIFNVGERGLHGLRFIDYMPEHKEES